MRAVTVGFVCALLLAFVLTPFLRRFAVAIRALDPHSARKLLRPSQVPRLGGVAIAVAFYLSVLLLFGFGSVVAHATLQTGTLVVPILLCGVPILLLGVVDDLIGLRALPKLVVEIAVALFLYAQGVRVLGTSGFAGPIDLPQLVSLVVTVLWMVGVMNAVNLIDGLDGLASGVAVLALVTMTIAALVRGEYLLAFLTGTLAGSTLGFLRYNFAPASIFMGDAGSLFLGYFLAATSIWSVRKSATLVLVVFPVVSLGLPLLDTGLTLSRRVLSGRPVLQADRDHVHHRLLLRGLPVSSAVLWLYGVCLVFSALSLVMVLCGVTLARVALLVSVLFALGLAYAFGYLKQGPHGLFAALARRRKTRQVLHHLDALSGKLGQAQTLPQVEAHVAAFGQELGLPLTLSFTEPQTPDHSLAIMTQGKPASVLAYLCHGRPEQALNPDERTLLAIFCDQLAPPLARLRPSP